MELRSFISVIFLYNIIPARGDVSHQCPELVQKTSHYFAVHAGTCYMFVNQEKYWNQASSHCLEMGGDLVTIKNAGIMNFLRTHLDSKDLGWTNKGVWIGARYYKDKGWRWTTGEKIGYSHWDSGEPSSFLGIISFENCAVMRRNDGWRWHDYHCGAFKFHYKYICQFPIAHSYQENGHSAHSAAGQHEDNGNMSYLLIVIGLAGLVIFGMLVVFFIYRKRQKDKHSHEDPVVRFENRSYGPVNQNEHTYGLSTRYNESRDQRPVSDMYMSPDEVNTLYEEVQKEVNHGFNTYHKDTNCLSSQPPPPPPPRSDSASATSSLCEGAVGGQTIESSSSLEEADKTPLIGATPLTPEEECELKGGNLYVDMKGGSKSSDLDVDHLSEKKKEAEPMYTNTVQLKSDAENPYEELPASK